MKSQRFLLFVYHLFRRRMLLLLFIIMAYSVNMSVLGENKELPKDKMCGPNSLSIISERLGIKLSPLVIAQLIGNKPETSMKDLVDVAHLLGLKAVGIKLSMKQFIKLNQPVIAHVKSNSSVPNHFLVVDQGIGDFLRLIDPDGSIRLMKQEKFAEIWDGNVLVVSRKEQSRLSGDYPDIHVDEPIYDFGQVGELETVSHTFTIRNVGLVPLQIHQVDQTCACIVAPLSEKVIPPEGTAQIKVKFGTGSRRGMHAVHIKVRSNDPDEPVIILAMMGVIAGIVQTSPHNLYLGTLRNNVIIHKTIQIYDPGHGKLQIKSVRATAPYISTQLKHLYKEGIVAEILVTIKPEMPLGRINEKIIIITNEKKYPETTLRVEGEVIGDLCLFPSQIFWGFVEHGTSVHQMIKLTNEGKSELKIIKIENESPIVTTEIETLEKGKSYHVKVTCKVPTYKKGIIKDTVKIYTNNKQQPILKVPLYAISR